MDSNKNLYSDAELREIFDKDILEVLGAEKLDQQKKEELYLQMAEIVQNRVTVRIMDALSEEDKESFVKILDEDDNAKVSDFLKNKNINPAQMLAEEAIVYKMELVTLVKGQNQAR